MELIKNDLESIGIKHDIFISESEIVKDFLTKAIIKLKSNGDI